MNSFPINPKHGMNGLKKDMDKLLNSTQMRFPEGLAEMSHKRMKDKHWYGGGSSKHRTVFCCYGHAAETTYDNMPNNKLTVWLEGNPIKFNYAWAQKQDVILVKSGFAPSRWTKELVWLLDKAGAIRILNWEKDRLNTTFLRDIDIKD
jgi:hypothetical protein